MDINGSCRLMPSHTLPQNAMNAVVAAKDPASCATLVRSVSKPRQVCSAVVPDLEINQ